MKKIVITGGHLTPALAVIEKLREFGDIDLVFIGRKYAAEGSNSYSIEYKIINEKGIKFHVLTTGRVQRKLTSYTFFSLLKIPIGFIQSFFILLGERPFLIVSFGGYLSVPVVFCGWLLGIRAIAHDQSTTAGLATKINSLFVEKIFLSWKSAGEQLPNEKTDVVGNPIRAEIFNKIAKDPKLKNFLARSGQLLFVTGGNQGAHSVNRVIFDLIESLEGWFVIHQVGTLNFKDDFALAKKIEKANSDRYLAVEYLENSDWGAVLNKAKMVISRSGANTVWELAVLSKVAILIPLPISASFEQGKNAEVISSNGGAVVIAQSDLSVQFLKLQINKVLKNYSKLSRRASNFSAKLPSGASEKIADYIRAQV